MTKEQEATLRRLCDGYKVTFDAADYHPQFDLPTGYVAGWIGGPEHAARSTTRANVSSAVRSMSGSPLTGTPQVDTAACQRENHPPSAGAT